MRLTTFAVSFALLLSLSAADTPLGFEPAVAQYLPMAFGGSYVEPGAILTEKQTASAPTLSWTDGNHEDKYAVVMIDWAIDLYGTLTTILQWYQPDFTFNTATMTFVISNASPPNAFYFSPSPIEGPPHKYIILLYRQEQGFELPECLQSTLSFPGRIGFNLDQFTEVTNLGPPIAANWFRVQNPTPATTTYAITDTHTISYACTATTEAI